MRFRIDASGAFAALFVLMGASGNIAAQQLGGAPARFATTVPTPRTDANSVLAHEDLVRKAGAGVIDVYFIGDSITRRWGALDYPELLAHFK